MRELEFVTWHSMERDMRLFFQNGLPTTEAET